MSSDEFGGIQHDAEQVLRKAERDAFAEKLKNELERVGLTADQAYQLVKTTISRQTWNSFVGGKMKPSDTMINYLNKTLGINL